MAENLAKGSSMRKLSIYMLFIRLNATRTFVSVCEHEPDVLGSLIMNYSATPFIRTNFVTSSWFIEHVAEMVLSKFEPGGILQ